MLSAALLAGCAAPPGSGACQARPMDLRNTASKAVEQLYFGAPGAWGTDLLGGTEVAPGATRSIAFPGTPGLVLRAVWTDGRAVELRGVDPCRNRLIVLSDRGIRAD